MSTPVLYMMFGYPGAGKTTTAHVISELTGAVHLSSDATRLLLFPEPTFSQAEHDVLYQYLDLRCEQLLREGKSVIYDANLNRYQHRQDKYDICDRTGATPVLLWVQTPKEIARERATHESRQRLWPQFITGGQLFERVSGVLENPRDNEPYISIDGTQVTPQYVQERLSSATTK
jgi:predicted kinase